MIDIDHFKAVNDRHGHDTGDRALAHVAWLMAQALGPADLPGRFGGEEFVVLLPAARLEQAQAQAERLRQRVRGQPLELDGGPLALSVSIGVAEWAGPDEDIARLLARADEALYRAKHQGRDRVEASPGAAATTQPQLL
jgi:diguanylate cyclase (GGDEF)-like protein